MSWKQVDTIVNKLSGRVIRMCWVKHIEWTVRKDIVRLEIEYMLHSLGRCIPDTMYQVSKFALEIKVVERECRWFETWWRRWMEGS